MLIDTLYPLFVAVSSGDMFKPSDVLDPSLYLWFEFKKAPPSVVPELQPPFYLGQESSLVFRLPKTAVNKLTTPSHGFSLYPGTVFGISKNRFLRKDGDHLAKSRHIRYAEYGFQHLLFNILEEDLSPLVKFESTIATPNTKLVIAKKLPSGMPILDFHSHPAFEFLIGSKKEIAAKRLPKVLNSEDLTDPAYLKAYESIYKHPARKYQYHGDQPLHLKPTAFLSNPSNVSTIDFEPHKTVYRLRLLGDDLRTDDHYGLIETLNNGKVTRALLGGFQYNTLSRYSVSWEILPETMALRVLLSKQDLDISAYPYRLAEHVEALQDQTPQTVVVDTATAFTISDVWSDPSLFVLSLYSRYTENGEDRITEKTLPDSRWFIQQNTQTLLIDASKPLLLEKNDPDAVVPPLQKLPSVLRDLDSDQQQYSVAKAITFHDTKTTDEDLFKLQRKALTPVHETVQDEVAKRQDLRYEVSVTKNNAKSHHKFVDVDDLEKKQRKEEKRAKPEAKQQLDPTPNDLEINDVLKNLELNNLHKAAEYVSVLHTMASLDHGANSAMAYLYDPKRPLPLTDDQIAKELKQEMFYSYEEISDPDTNDPPTVSSETSYSPSNKDRETDWLGWGIRRYNNNLKQLQQGHPVKLNHLVIDRSAKGLENHVVIPVVLHHTRMHGNNRLLWALCSQPNPHRVGNLIRFYGLDGLINKSGLSKHQLSLLGVPNDENAMLVSQLCQLSSKPSLLNRPLYSWLYLCDGKDTDYRKENAAMAASLYYSGVVTQYVDKVNAKGKVVRTVSPAHAQKVFSLFRQRNNMQGQNSALLVGSVFKFSSQLTDPQRLQKMKAGHGQLTQDELDLYRKVFTFRPETQEGNIDPNAYYVLTGFEDESTVSSENVVDYKAVYTLTNMEYVLAQVASRQRHAHKLTLKADAGGDIVLKLRGCPQYVGTLNKDAFNQRPDPSDYTWYISGEHLVGLSNVAEASPKAYYTADKSFKPITPQEVRNIRTLPKVVVYNGDRDVQLMSVQSNEELVLQPRQTLVVNNKDLKINPLLFLVNIDSTNKVDLEGLNQPCRLVQAADKAFLAKNCETAGVVTQPLTQAKKSVFKVAYAPVYLDKFLDDIGTLWADVDPSVGDDDDDQEAPSKGLLRRSVFDLVTLG